MLFCDGTSQYSVLESLKASLYFSYIITFKNWKCCVLNCIFWCLSFHLFWYILFLYMDQTWPYQLLTWLPHRVLYSRSHNNIAHQKIYFPKKHCDYDLFIITVSINRSLLESRKYFIPWLEVSEQAELVWSDRPGRTAAYACNYCAPLPVYGVGRCSAGQDSGAPHRPDLCRPSLF